MNYKISIRSIYLAGHRVTADGETSTSGAESDVSSSAVTQWLDIRPLNYVIPYYIVQKIKQMTHTQKKNNRASVKKNISTLYMSTVLHYVFYLFDFFSTCIQNIHHLQHHMPLPFFGMKILHTVPF